MAEIMIIPAKDRSDESSYEAQIGYYTEKINSNAEWQMAGIFADEGITVTQAKKRPEFLKMIRLCRQGKIADQQHLKLRVGKQNAQKYVRI